MKQPFFLILFSLIVFIAHSQDSTGLTNTDTNQFSVDTAKVLDTLPVAKQDTPVNTAVIYFNQVQKLLTKSSFLNSTGESSTGVNAEKNRENQENIFYFLLALLTLLGFLKFFYSRYLNNLFRVFFNTSLKQSQLTDQLLQDKQASMFFNILFFFIAGIYIYFLLQHFGWINQEDDLGIISICAVGIAIVYFLKFINMKFTGWLTGYNAAANTYLFIIFLINKILAILLIPFVIVIAFSPDYLKKVAIVFSIIMVCVMFLLRFLRSFTLLHRQIKVSRLHFLLYIAGVEVLPVMLIYKGVMILLNKNL